MYSVPWYLGTLYTIYKANIFFAKSFYFSSGYCQSLNQAVLFDLQRKPSHLFYTPDRPSCSILALHLWDGKVRFTVIYFAAINYRTVCNQQSWLRFSISFSTGMSLNWQFPSSVQLYLSPECFTTP